MDSVQKFVSENQHQLGYIMQEASRQWVQKDPVGALTMGTCKAFIDVHGDYQKLLDKIECYEKALEERVKEIEELQVEKARLANSEKDLFEICLRLRQENAKMLNQ